MIWILILDPHYIYQPTKSISPVGKGWEHTPGLSVGLYGLPVFDLACLLELLPLLQGQTRIAKVKSAINLLIIGPRALQCETNLQEIMGWESFDVVRLDLEHLLQHQTRTAKSKSACNLLISDPRVLQCENNS